MRILTFLLLLSGVQFAQTISPIVFVSRQIPARGTVYWNVPRGLPGVMPFSRFQVASPGSLIVRQSDGTLRTLVDGAKPSAGSLRLVDVNAPDVSWDGAEIVFSGLPEGTYSREPMTDPGAWRIFAIKVDGTGIRQLTRSDRTADFSQFGAQAHLFDAYDDTDPAWLPDGRVVFSSTRFPGFAMYGAAHTSNLFVMNASGAGLHRITAERNAAERPQVDPSTGRIVFSRWWRNFRFATDSMATFPDSGGGYRQHLGLVAANRADDSDLGGVPGGPVNLSRNGWHLASINPDGTGLRMFSGGSQLFFDGEDRVHAYGGSFAPDGSFYSSYFPMKNGTEASGFGGVRRFRPGFAAGEGIIGVTESSTALVSRQPPSYGVFVGNYAAEPEVLPDGQVLVSWARDVGQDYGLYLVSTGGPPTLIYDQPGTAQLRARAVRRRALPPILGDRVSLAASQVPPLAGGPYEIDGTFIFNALNVYFNAPVDAPVVNAIPVGSAGTIRFFIDHQREQRGSLEAMDWPILLREVAVNADGSVPPVASPANVPLFEQIRTPRAAGYKVPLTGAPGVARQGAAHVAGLNYGRPGENQTCVGCHAGHSLIPVPANLADAHWTNLATGARVSFSSTHPNPYIDHTGRGLIDRQVMRGSIVDYWRSDPAQKPNGQWVELRFPVPVQVRSVKLYNPRADPELKIQVNRAVVALMRDGQSQPLLSKAVGALKVTGTSVAFGDRAANAVRVYLTDVTGMFQGEAVASLAEIEVIARAVK